MEEVSISLAETNILRARIGLPLIPEPKKEDAAAREEVKGGRESLSVDETNRLRASLGLKPIPTGEGGTGGNKIDTSVPAASTGSASGKLESGEDSQRPGKTSERIGQGKIKHVKLSKTLLEDYEPHDTDEWLKSLTTGNSGQSEVATKQQQEANYDKSSELHPDTVYMDALSDGDVLTLEDHNILSDDELETLKSDHVELTRRDEKDIVKGSNRLVGNDHSDVGNKDTHVQSADNEHSGKSDADGSTLNERHSASKVVSGTLFADDQFEFGDTGVSITKKSIKMKKLKKKSKAQPKARVEEDDVPTFKQFDLEIAKDEEDRDEFNELESVLSLTRRNKNKRSRMNITPEQIANEVKRAKLTEHQEELERKAYLAGSNAQSEIIYDNTADFLSSLTNHPIDDSKEPQSHRHSNETAPSDETQSVNSPRETHDGQIDPGRDDASESGKKEEPNLGRSLASTLRFLEARNELTKSTPQEREQDHRQREALKEAELFKVQLSIEERLLRDQLHSDKHYMTLPKTERESIFTSRLEEIMDQKGLVPHRSSRRAAVPSSNGIKDYKPSVKISHRDDTGKELDTKQAFKFMSRKFHGYKPNKDSSKKGTGMAKKRSNV